MRRVTIGTGPSERGPRIGGRPPAGLSPARGELQYFVTVPLWLDGSEEVSIFLNPSPDFIYGPAAATLVSGPDFELLRHPASQRAAGPTAWDSELTEHPLQIGPPEPDEHAPEADQPPALYSGHKLGGAPYLVENEPSLQQSIAALLAGGYAQLIQLDFPAGPDDGGIDGPWPFGTGLFHALVRVRGSALEWRCFWEL